jgi:hypothetical protein
MQTKQDNNMADIKFKTITLTEDYSRGDSSRYVETFFVNINGRILRSEKCRIIVETRNGFPIGYNYNCHLQIWMHPTGWVELTDNRNIGVPYDNCYVSDADRKRKMTYDAVEGFKEFLKNWFDE